MSKILGSMESTIRPKKGRLGVGGDSGNNGSVDNEYSI